MEWRVVRSDKWDDVDVIACKGLEL